MRADTASVVGPQILLGSTRPLCWIAVIHRNLLLNVASNSRRRSSHDPLAAWVSGLRVTVGVDDYRTTAVLWRTTVQAASIKVMTDLLESILADPELQQWPRRGGHSTADAGPQTTPRDSAAESVVSAPPNTAGDAHEDAIDKLNSLIGRDRTQAPESGVATENDDPELQPQSVSIPENAIDRTPEVSDGDADTAATPCADEAVTEPIAFDDISARRKPITDRITGAGHWLKERDWRNPKTLAAAAAAVVATAAIGLWWGGAAGQDSATPTAQITRQGSAEPSPPAPTGAQVTDSVIGPEAITAATARCPAPSSDPMNALRPDSAEPWICVRAWQIDGQLLQITFDRAYVITSVGLVPGANTEIDNEDQWVKYRTVSRVNWSFNDQARTRLAQTTGDRRELVSIPVAANGCRAAEGGCPLVASAVTLTIEKTSEPSNPGSLDTPAASLGADYTAFAISRIEIIGHPAG